MKIVLCILIAVAIVAFCVFIALKSAEDEKFHDIVGICMLTITLCVGGVALFGIAWRIISYWM